jgi:Amidohydrolase family
LVIANVTIIDMTGAPPKADQVVLIEGGRITQIGKAAKTRIPEQAQIIDGQGKFLIPSFWDMHVHFFDSERTLPLFVANGVLGVRELGGPMDDVLRWRAEAAAGKIVSPRIVTAGRILDGDPPASRPEYTDVAKTPDDGRKAVRKLKARGVDLIKVYDKLTRDTYFAIADEAKRLRLPFAGHTPTEITTLEASNAGQRTIEHLGKTLEDSSADPQRVRTAQSEKIPPNDFFAFTTRIGRYYDAILATYSEKKAGELFARFRRNKTWQVPTLVTKYGRTYIDELDARGDVRGKYLPKADVDYWKPSVGFFSRYRTPSYITAQKAYFQKELQLVGDMNRAGVSILAGSDSTAAYVIPGFSLHDELALLVSAGLTPMQALRTATRNPAEYLGELRQHGTVEKGKAADLILLDADPIADIKNTTRINAVIQRGRFLSRSDLDRILADVELLASKKASN